MELRAHIDTGDLPLSDSNPCNDCGLCCKVFRISFYQGELDCQGGTVPSDNVVKINDFMVCMKGSEAGSQHTGCYAQAPDGKCSIYANRPSVCREYLVWDEKGTPNPRCQALREQAGIPLLQPIATK